MAENVVLKLDNLFPAHAGVILGTILLTYLCKSFPRTRGGDPIQWTTIQRVASFSPHTRG